MDLVCGRDGLPRDGIMDYSDLDSLREEFFVDLDSGSRECGIALLDERSKARCCLSVTVGCVLCRLDCRELLTSCSSASFTVLPSWDRIRRISRRASSGVFRLSRMSSVVSLIVTLRPSMRRTCWKSLESWTPESLDFSSVDRVL